MSLRSWFTSVDVKQLQDEYEKNQKALRAVKEELEELKLKKRLEAEEIKHMQRIEQEKNKMEIEQTKIKLEREKASDITMFKEQQRVQLVDSLKDFHSKLEKQSNEQLANMKEIYNMLTQKLPNVNYNIEKKITHRE